MNDNLDFYKWFDGIAPKLDNREISFRKIFKYLDSQPNPIIIVETGCLRVKDNFLDGQSTLLFDKYTLSRGEKSKVYTVDKDPNSTKICKQTVSDNVEITTDDSVHYLNNLTHNFFTNKTKVSMFYLDSFDIDWRYPYPSAVHHLKELGKIFSSNWKFNAKSCSIGKFKSAAPIIAGKGFLVHYASENSHYQVAWNFNK